MTATAVPLRFQIGARTLLTIPRRLERIALSLDDVLARTLPEVPALAADADGYLFTSLPKEMVADASRPGLIAFRRQEYVRHHADLTIGYQAWLAGMSGNARSSLRRKQKKLAQHADYTVIRRFRTVSDLSEFHVLARPLAALTYQERLLGSGLPDDAGFKRRTEALAAKDQVRAWLMTLGDRPIAYLWCSAQGGSLRYDYVGHDPALADLSPGTVLHAAAFEDLFAEGRFARFDFTEGEGQHKRQFATAGEACVDLLLLRATVSNHATLAALRAFDGGVAAIKRVATRPALANFARRVRRA